jgi:hypothetical protein
VSSHRSQIQCLRSLSLPLLNLFPSIPSSELFVAPRRFYFHSFYTCFYEATTRFSETRCVSFVLHFLLNYSHFSHLAPHFIFFNFIFPSVFKLSVFGTHLLIFLILQNFSDEKTSKPKQVAVVDKVHNSSKYKCCNNVDFALTLGTLKPDKHRRIHKLHRKHH